MLCLRYVLQTHRQFSAVSSASSNEDASVMTLHCATPHSNMVWMSRYAFCIKGNNLKNRIAGQKPNCAAV